MTTDAEAGAERQAVIATAAIAQYKRALASALNEYAAVAPRILTALINESAELAAKLTERDLAARAAAEDVAKELVALRREVEQLKATLGAAKNVSATGVMADWPDNAGDDFAHGPASSPAATA